MHPGYVNQRSNYISGPRLVQLYGLHVREFVIWDDADLSTYAGLEAGKFFHLYPDPQGRYGRESLRAFAEASPKRDWRKEVSPPGDGQGPDWYCNYCVTCGWSSLGPGGERWVGIHRDGEGIYWERHQPECIWRRLRESFGMDNGD